MRACLSRYAIDLIRGVVGAQNVGLVYARWGSLNHAPFRALTYMALRSLDSGNPPLFWGGRDELAIALGRPIPEPYGDEFEKKCKADREMVKKVVRELTRAGAVSLVKAPTTGQNAVYELHLRAGLLPGTGGTSVPPGGGTSVPPTSESGGNSLPRVVVPEFPPKEPVGVLKDLRARSRIDGEGDHQAAGFAREDEAEKANGFSEKNSRLRSVATCSECSTLLDPDGTCFRCHIAAANGVAR